VTDTPVRIGVLLSGRGSNFEALQSSIERREIPAEISLVVSNRPRAKGIATAKARGLETAVFDHKEIADRDAHEAKVLAALEAAEVEWVCLAGYMRLLSSRFVAAYPERILNIHPSLLPAFPGLDAQRQALEYGAKVAGCTVHLVDEGLDSGPIVEQRTVSVREDDTEETLSARILAEEHRAYPAALQRLLMTPWRVDGRRVVFAERNS